MLWCPNAVEALNLLYSAMFHLGYVGQSYTLDKT